MADLLLVQPRMTMTSHIMFGQMTVKQSCSRQAKLDFAWHRQCEASCHAINQSGLHVGCPRGPDTSCLACFLGFWAGLHGQALQALVALDSASACACHAVQSRALSSTLQQCSGSITRRCKRRWTASSVAQPQRQSNCTATHALSV